MPYKILPPLHQCYIHQSIHTVTSECSPPQIIGVLDWYNIITIINAYLANFCSVITSAAYCASERMAFRRRARDYFHEEVTASLKRDKFEVTDFSEPPQPSVWYTQCSSQTAVTQCMIITSSGKRRGRRSGQVAKIVSSVGDLEQIFNFSRSKVPNTGAYLPGVAKDIPKILELISKDPKKSITEEPTDTEGSREVYMEKICCTGAKKMRRVSILSPSLIKI